MLSIRRTLLLWLRIVQQALMRLRSWWLAEFLGLFPRRLAVWLIDCGPRRATLALGPNTVILQLENDEGRAPVAVEVDRNEYGPEVLDEFLHVHKLSRKDAALGLRISADMIFERRLVLPLEASHSLEAVTAQDLALNTPFQLAHVYHDHSSVTDGNRIIAFQWVVPHAVVVDVLEPLGENISSFAFIEAAALPDQDQPKAYINLVGGRAAGKSVMRTLALGLAALAVLLAITAGAIRYSLQEDDLVRLAIELPAAAAKARAVRAALETSNGKQALIADIRSSKGRKPGLLDVWEEVSQMLPQNSWLTELRTLGAFRQRRLTSNDNWVFDHGGTTGRNLGQIISLCGCRSRSADRARCHGATGAVHAAGDIANFRA